MHWSPLNLGKGLVAPAWATTLGWLLALSSVSLLPIWAIYALATTPGTLPQVTPELIFHQNKILKLNRIKGIVYKVTLTFCPTIALQTSVQACPNLIWGPPTNSLQPRTAPDREAKGAGHRHPESHDWIMFSDDVTLTAGQPIRCGEGEDRSWSKRCWVPI